MQGGLDPKEGRFLFLECSNHSPANFMRILSLDPGTSQTAFLVWDKGIVEFGILPNEEMLSRIKENNFGGAELCAIEWIASYGMPVGKEVFETCLFIGRMIERVRMPYKLIYRKDVKMFLCGTMRAKDANVRQALIDLVGVQGTKKNPGPTFGITSHTWSALAIALYAESLSFE